MEEQRRVQENETNRNTVEGTAAGQTSSSGGNLPVDNSSTNNAMDVTRMTEDEQLALAIQMSMSQAENNDVEMKEETTTTAKVKTK